MCLGTQLYKRKKKIRLMLGLNSQNLSFKDLGKVVKAENILPRQIYFRAADQWSRSRLSSAEGRVTPRDKSQVYRRATQRVKLVHSWSHVPEIRHNSTKGNYSSRQNNCPPSPRSISNFCNLLTQQNVKRTFFLSINASKTQ